MIPMANMDSSDAMKPPMFTMPVAVPTRIAGLKVRAKSKAIMEPGPPTASASTRAVSSGRGAGPGYTSTASQAPAISPAIARTIVDRRSGCRPTYRPSRGPQTIPTATKRVIRVEAGASPTPSARTR